MIFATTPVTDTPLRAAIRAVYLADETACVASLIERARLDADGRGRVAARARCLVEAVRARRREQGGLDALLHAFDLSSEEGVVLMCLAEALLRIPDAETADRLIRDRLAHADWERHLGQSESLFVNAATWGLMLTGRVIELDSDVAGGLGATIGRLVARSGEPVIRAALKEAMRILGHQFVTGRTIDEALQRSHAQRRSGHRYSFDMLGEAALTDDDAQRYFEAYRHAIAVIAAAGAPGPDVFAAPGISVKLSALHPRFEFAQQARVVDELVPRLRALAHAARQAGLGLTVDAEEAERLDVTLDVFEAVYTDRALDGWNGLGIAVQAYQKRALPVIDWLAALAREHGRRVPLRLVKGAYWDTEIKRAQERGLPGYPVFTRKLATDVSFLACARRVLDRTDAFYPQFATHNAYSVAAVADMAGDRAFEFQRLHGMGETLYRVAGEALGARYACRVYAPVGGHADLLPYLVRRLLENGANTSFLHRIEDERTPVEGLIRDPVDDLEALARKPHPRIPLPRDLYGSERRNARGLNLHDRTVLVTLATAMGAAATKAYRAAPLVDGERADGVARAVVSPADRRSAVGQVVEAQPADVERAVAAATRAAPAWAATAVAERAAVLERAADLMEDRAPELMMLCVREGGRCIPDALAEVREAVDYCRYYAGQARRLCAEETLPGPTGERNTLALHARGVFACISPWNFPLAIFTGQVAAALAAGNAVVAKPARQTPLTAMRAVELLHEAGVPAAVLDFLPGSSGVIGERLLADVRLGGVAFTGSTASAHVINRLLAQRAGAIIPLIAETGGQNAMIVDSSALAEQVVADVLSSAFNSAGQRCSALRVLFLQNEIAPRVIELLRGAMAELRIGDPTLLATDVGPVIDAAARVALADHVARMQSEGSVIFEAPLPAAAGSGNFIGPCAFEIDSLARLGGEVFGPVLHVIRFAANDIDAVVDAINATGYGLTLGIHSRIESTVQRIRRRARVGNVYVNRNMIGAVVGAQPFGGEGRSGTGPKAGGPHYLTRFTSERSVAVNTAALGGNASLLTIGDDP